MRWPWKSRRAATIAAVLVPLAAVFAYVAARTGPLAPVPVTVAAVETRAIEPALHGIGTVEARYTHRVGPTSAGRVLSVAVDVGDRVRAGQLLAEIDPVDLEARLAAQQAALARAEANVRAAEALVADAKARAAHATSQARRYEALAREGAASVEAFDTKRQEQLVGDAAVTAAAAGLDAARKELARSRAELDALARQRSNLRLVAPVDGLVTVRSADPGSTAVAGQPVVELIDPATVWINVRFDQLRASGLRAGLPARIALRSRSGDPIAGRVLRVEPLADAVTEELLAKVSFEALPHPLPAVGELAEVTVALPLSPPAPVVASASVTRVDGRLGVWALDGGELRFTPVKAGASDLEGRVQVVEGLRGGEHVVVYSQRALRSHSRVAVVERLPGARP
jgi:RND family efflux transporter MFP subunit